MKRGIRFKLSGKPKRAERSRSKLVRVCAGVICRYECHEFSKITTKLLPRFLVKFDYEGIFRIQDLFVHLIMRWYSR